MLVAAAGLGLSAQAQTTQKLSAAKHNDYGLVYSLPSTHLRIEIEAEQTVKKAGPYYNYAKKYLGTTDVVLQDSKSWTLKSIKVSSYGVPEKGNEYLMQFKSGATPFMVVHEDGLPLSINTDDVEAPEYQKGEATPLTESLLDDNAYTSALSGELLASGSLAKRAENAASTIYKLRESRTNYALGEADQMPPDGEAMKLILNELNKQEEALKVLFLGTTQTATAVEVIDFTPTADTQDEVLLRISDFNGISSKDDLSGEPLYISVKILTKGEAPLDEKGAVKKLPKGAVMYNIPGKARISLKYEGEEVFSDIFDIAQFGVEYGLNPSLFTDKKAPSYIKFHPATGGIKEIGVVEKGSVSKKVSKKKETSEEEADSSIDGLFD